MSRTLEQIFTDNPITTNLSADLMYFARSPYTPGNDCGMTFADFAAQFGTPYTASALTRTNDTNVTLTLGGTPATSLLQAVSLTLGWTGQLSPARGGTGVNNGTSTLTLGGNLTTSGAFASTFTMTGITTVTFPTSGTLATTSQIPSVTPSAMTKVDDTNVTLTLGGTPATSLLQAVSLTLGWTGTLSGTRGGTGVNNGASTITLGGSLTTSGAFASTFTMTGITTVTFPTSGTLATTSQIPSVTPSAMTKVDDTNVTLTLGGTPATSLLQAVSLTLGWTGTLAITRGGTGISSFGTGVQTALGQNVTGSGGFVLATSPTITTPKIAQINDSNGVEVVGILGNASAVNYLQFSNNITANSPLIAAAGSDTNIALQLNGKGTDGVVEQGATNGAGVATGYKGEKLTVNVPSASAVSFTSSNAAKDCTSLNLTAGNWMVFGNMTIQESTANITFGTAWLSLSSATLPDASLRSGTSLTGTTFLGLTCPFLLVSVSSTTPVYLSGLCTYTVNTATMCGTITAIRI